MRDEAFLQGLVMALDVQPLSATRRVILLVVLLALLAGSLGVAQLLVQRVKTGQGRERENTPVRRINDMNGPGELM